MEKHTGFWSTAMLVTVLCGCGPAIAAEGPAPLTLVVDVSGPTVPADVLARAQRDVDAIYRRVGVRLVWDQHPHGVAAEDVNAPASANGPLHLTAMITTSRNDVRAPQAAILGITPRTDFGEPSAVVYAFYDRIEALSREMRVDVAHLLGHVLAHEMGHALIPYDSHSRGGIMKGVWDKSQVTAAQCGWLVFSDEEGALIRSTVSRPIPVASSASR
jgi:hypothetical protein